MINLPPAPAEEVWRFSPGTSVQLPDGRITVIQESLPDGSFRTREGLVILPDGRIAQNEGAEKARIVSPAGELPESAASGEGAGQGQKKTDSAMGEIQKKPDGGISRPQEEKPGQGMPRTASEEKSAPEAASGGESQITIAGLLPMTPIRAPEKTDTPAAKVLPGHAKRPDAGEGEPAGRQGVKAPAKAKKEPAPMAGQEKASPGKSATRPGEHLRIPPEAAKSGSLDFLEGCWQGTRPEYYSKRSIRECFCFDGRGVGKRRIIDPAAGGRMCIGPARASLSRAGVLSVTSGRSPCTDGERWGQAEMVCRGEGSRTPCSWVFRDARGGRQAYEIPLVRVGSCGR